MTNAERRPDAAGRRPGKVSAPQLDTVHGSEPVGQLRPEPARPRFRDAVAFAHPPAGRRHMWAIVVPTCPACSHMHLHRSAAAPEEEVRIGSCGAAYRLRLAGAKRRRWAG
ncbi:hypothetical protein SAMN05216207_10786 [Pseudonocardia ammonioxydans]|uniref:Uncharacterized protein n=1 Tax=Pseudonocardia ammonioxydans TaxID=260086 RepID=A0A1I5HXJ3_PSUAM|nr:hypothetical protein SAMN05216207_10786 [Pseudonocardia ammonioxydans]